MLLVAACGWFVGPILERRETDRADSRLATTLNAVRAESTRAFADAQVRAVALATSPTLRRALLRRDRSAVLDFEANHPDVVVTMNPSAPSPSLASSVAVQSGGKMLGTIHVLVSLADVVKRVEADSRGTALLITRADRVVRGPGRGQRLRIPAGRPTEITVRGKRYRALAARLAGSGQAASKVVALASSNLIEARASKRRNLVVLGTLAALAAVFLTVWIAAQASRRREREPNRGRGHGVVRISAREALALVGEALAATHEPQALLAVILNAAIEATGAVGGRLLDNGVEIARVGELPRDVETLDLMLEAEGGERGMLQLFSPPSGFGAADISLARSLASQASIALENAHLHRIVERQAATDELTQLANRRAFMEALASEKRRSDRSGDPFSVVVVDLDDFKRVNDRYGHQMGDDVLHRFARVVERELREVDVPARIGGEEFAILLPQTDLAGAAALAERIRAALSDEHWTSNTGGGIRATASFGVAVYPLTGSISAVLGAADTALYEAKATGKNRVATAAATVIAAPVGRAPKRRRPPAP